MGRVALYGMFLLGGLIALAILAFVLFGGLYRAPSESMAPTIAIGDRFTILEIGSAEVGDIVVFNPPEGANGQLQDMCGAPPPAGQMCAKPAGGRADVKFVKRIVAAGGDKIAMRDGKIVRNGKRETTEGPQTCEDDGCAFPREITVPAGHVFMLGDNRGSSDDSRFWGPVPEDWVIGRYWFGVS